MKILFVIKALANPGGGAEKVLVQVASGLAVRGHDVAVLTSDSPTAQSYYSLDESIKFLKLGIGNTKSSAGLLDSLRRIRGYRRSIMTAQPDVVVAFMHSSFIPVGIALAGSRIPMVASEHIGPEHYADRMVQRLLLLATPLLAKRITVVSAQILRSFGGWLRRSMVEMPNPVVVGKSVVDGNSVTHGERLVLLSVGRLATQKDHRILIDAFAQVARAQSEWTLRIVGEGELREDLERQIQALGLAERIELPGAVSAIDDEYRAADLFALSSSYESFGLATAEALLHGLPAIGFADCPGTNELISDGVNGRLVRGDERVNAMAAVLHELMSNHAERHRLAGAANGHLAERFGLEGVLNQWESLLGDVII